MKRLSKGTWVLVADGDKALFLENVADAIHPELAVRRVDAQDNPPDREQGTDKPGRRSDTGPGQRSAMEETDWHELAKMRFADDLAVMGGLARFNDQPVVVIGHEKGSDTKGRIAHNFGMARPEGYRKAVRLMEMAGRFGLPVITLVDTAGAYPGKGAEERGQSEAIARSTDMCLKIGVPLISVIIGEGGSGGAVAFATANRVAMLEHSIYSVISPEGCASILWKDAEKMREAAEALRLTAQDLKALEVADRVIPEPLGGAHRDPTATYKAVSAAITEMLKDLSKLDGPALIKDRREKFLKLGSKGLAA